jgi:4-amino-4-deoxy-L-arabinose transferase-like glycosyltransferase
MTLLKKIHDVKINWVHLIVFVFVFLFTFILRAHNYERTPTSNHLDEQLYAWSGMYLVEEGVPVSWSTLDYPKRNEVFEGEINYKGGSPKASVVLYKPWLDEPPLFSYLVGYSAHLFGAEKTDFVPSSFIRFPIVLISAITSILVFLIAKKVSGFWTGILSMLVFGTVPVFVFASRTAMPETLISFFYSLLVFMIILFEKKLKFWYILPLPVLAGLAGLSKPTGFFLLPIAIFFVVKKLYENKNLKLAPKYILYMLVALAPFVIFFFWWGVHLDKELFMRINSIQSNRPVGFGSLAWFFITPSVDTSILRDSWYVFGLLSVAYFLFSKKTNLQKIVIISFVYWILVVMISGGENDLLSWYRFPAFPFMAIIMSWGLIKLVQMADFFASFIAAGMLLGNRMLLVTPLLQNVRPPTYRFVLGSLMLPSTLNMILEKKILISLSKWIIIGIIVVGIYLNTKYIYNAYELACENTTCPFVPTTFLSTIRFPYFWRFLVIR